MGTEETCGHTAHGASGTFVCDLAPGHRTLHAQRTPLRSTVDNVEYISTTNWGDDGLAPHATKDPRAKS